ncbi:MAG: RNA methyltransferase, partial [Candidatus Limnocylindrales bacterium]
AVGIDLNPIATLISRVKVQRWGAEDDRQLDSHAVDLRWAAQRGNQEVLEEARARIPRIDHWFSAEAQALLAGATGYARTIDDPIWRDRVSLAISSSVVRVSRQDSDTRYAAVDKRWNSDRAARIFETSLAKVAVQLRSFAPSHCGKEVSVITADAARSAELVAPSSVAAAIFSPPYPNAYEYWLYHKYRMYWLGFDPLSVRASEWGARPHYSGTGKSTINTFSEQMAPVMDAVARALVPSGICLVVVGDSLIKGELLDNASLFERLARAAGLRAIGRSSRPIRASRKSFNLAVARARDEHVLLFRR